VNDRPYVASSFMSVAIAQVFGSALAGSSKERAELVKTPIPLAARLAVLPCRGGEGFLRRLFEPLGYAVTAARHPLDEAFPEWGEGPYFTVELSHTSRCTTAHAPVRADPGTRRRQAILGRPRRLEKLLRHGEGWLAAHPEKDQITHRYLKHPAQPGARGHRPLMADEPEADEAEEQHAVEEEQVERKISLNDQRLDAVGAALKTSCQDGARPGLQLRQLLRGCWRPQFERVVGLDVSHRALEIAADRLHLDRMAPKQRERITLLQGLTHLPRRAPRRLRRGGGGRGDRAPAPRGWPLSSACVFEFARRGPWSSRRRTSSTTSASRRCRRQVPPPRPPLRVDARTVPGLGDRGRAAVRVRGRVSAGRA
jgi:3' terminal RNA ribose 2'-O-methyltransferase Hen1